MFELKLESGFDNMINLVALSKVSSFHVRSKKCDQNVTRPPGGLITLLQLHGERASTAGHLRSELPRSRWPRTADIVPSGGKAVPRCT